MSVDLSELLAERRNLEISLAGGMFKMNIVYNPASQTEDIERQVKQAIDEEQLGKAIRIYVKTVVKEWDLTENGEPIPIEDEPMIMKVPSKILVTIFQAVGEDLRSGEARSSSDEHSGIQTFQG